MTTADRKQKLSGEPSPCVLTITITFRDTDGIAKMVEYLNTFMFGLEIRYDSSRIKQQVLHLE